MAKAKVTREEKKLAIRMANEASLLVKRAIAAAARIGFKMQSVAINHYKRKNNQVIPSIERNLLKMKVELRDAMVYAHLAGLNRVLIENRKAKRKVTLSLASDVYRGSIKFLQTRLNMSPSKLRRIREVYDAEALRVTNNTTLSVERSIQKVILQATQDEVHVQEGVKRLREAFDNFGMTSTKNHTLEAIFRTQTQIAYSAGSWNSAFDPDTEEILWGFKYVAIEDERVRPTHVALNGTQLPKDNPRWKEIYPPNGYNCRCKVIPIYEERNAIFPPDVVKVDGRNIIVAPDKGFVFNPGEVFKPFPPGEIPKPRTRPRPKPKPKVKKVRKLKPRPKPKPKPIPKPTRALYKWKKQTNLNEAKDEFDKHFEENFVQLQYRDIDKSSSDDVAFALEATNAIGEDTTRMFNEFPAIAQQLQTAPAVGKEFEQKLKKVQIVNSPEVGRTRSGARILGQYDPNRKSVQVATKGVSYRYSGKESYPQFGKWGVSTSVQDVYRHEMGHVLQHDWVSEHFTRIDTEFRALYKSAPKEYWRVVVGDYASTSYKELFAECFSVYTHRNYGLPGKHRLPKSVEDIFVSRFGLHPNLVGQR